MENYKKLVEIQSLYNHIGNYLEDINSQNNRLLLIEKQREKRSEELENFNLEKDVLNKDITELEKELFDREKELSKTTDHLSMASNESQANALQKELDFLSPKVDSIQESILEKMETIESLEEKISESLEFLSGSSESLKDLQNEVDTENLKTKKDIDNHSSRIELLFDSVDNNVKKSFSSIFEKSKDKRAIAFLKGRSCSVCRTEAPSMQISEIENARSIEFCMGCGKILIPSTINAL
jgi:predicted  nucleic acid-binding Zn-ribbon protein